ncbi:hypothetical protein BJY52DRAFT_1289682 [Lactarius psammicola]|nr:hypothetical protein BJY52DRAFT_1289682 [Lactarius psammicola]
MAPSEKTPLLVNGPFPLGLNSISTSVHAQDQPSWSDSLRWLLFGSQFNIIIMTLFLSVPLAAIANHLAWDEQHFELILISFIPLAKLQSDAAEQMSLYLRRTPRALLGTTFANAVELIVGLVALFRGQIRIVQAIMLGSVLSNLFILTASFVASLDGHHCERKIWIATETTLALILNSLAYITPPTYSLVQYIGSPELLIPDPPGHSLIVSRYAALFFLAQQLVRWRRLFRRTTQYRKNTREMSVAAASLALCIITVLIYFAANSLQVASTGDTLGSYLGLILLPFLSKVAGYTASISTATTHTTLCMAGLCVGNTLQITCFTFPFLVIVGWASGHDLSLVYKQGRDIELHRASLNFLSTHVVGVILRAYLPWIITPERGGGGASAAN